jgi:PAS domain S-box-containing protein
MGAFFENIEPVIATMSLVDALVSSEHLGTALQKQWSVTFVSEFLGMIVIAPMILAWTHGGWRESSRTLKERALKDSTPELVVLFAGLVFTTHIVFGANPNAAWFVPALSYLCAPFLIWAALRFGLRSATLALAIFSLICYWHTARGSGPFSIGGVSSWTSMLHMQAYLATVTVTTLFAAVLLAERDAAARTTEAWRRRHEAAIRASGNLLYELDPEAGTFLWDGDTRAVLGLDHDDIATVAQWAKRVHPDDSERVRAVRERLISGELLDIAVEYRIQHGNGSWITVGVNGYVIEDPMRPRSGRRRIISFVSDISEKVHAEEQRQALAAQLRQAEKMEAVGRLAGGIAHDFNNLLTTILGGISQAKDNHDYSRLADAESACSAAKSLTRQLLTFSKGSSANAAQQVVAPAEILQDAVRIAAAGSTAVVSVEVKDGTSPIEVDRGQILQVFQNLIINAVQAMPDPSAGRVTLRATNVVVAEGEVPPLPTGSYVQIEVEDNGAGIPQENLGKIFEPFFTTKKQGTGLGLATVLAIVRKHGGQIGVDSTVGAGTTFTLFFPQSTRPIEVPVRKAPALRFGTGRVLFMDDDAKICDLTAGMLASLDYTFDIVKNGADAITFYKRYLNIGRPYDAVILDLNIIGGMGGEECFKALRDLHPDVRAIVSSGYDSDEMARRYYDMGFVGYLSKPYRATELGKAIKAALGTAS